MTSNEKIELYRLLQKYMTDLLDDDHENNKNYESRKRNGWQSDNQPISGVKAQFNHARCIMNRLGVQIERILYT